MKTRMGRVLMALLAVMVSSGPAFSGDAPGWREGEQREYEQRKRERETPPPPPAPYTARQEQALDNELQINGGFFHALGSDSGNYSLDVSYGRFFGNQFEAGVRQALNVVTIDNARDQWLMSTTGFALYHLQLDDAQIIVPFAGGFAGAAYNDQDAAPVVGPTAGVRFYAVRSTFIQAAYRYEWFPGDLKVGNKESSANHVVTLGIGWRF